MKKPYISNFVKKDGKAIDWHKYACALEAYIQFLET